MAERLEVLAIIPIRGGDPEARHGCMLTLGQKPILAYTIESARASRLITRIVVSTDDADVVRVARQQGAEAPFLRPKELSSQDVSLGRVLQHALLWLEEREGYRADLVVLLEITHPIRPPGLIDRVIEVLLAEQLDSVFVAREERHEFWYFNARGALERVQPSEDSPRQKLPPLYKEMRGMVTVMRADLVRTAKRLGERVGLVPLRDASSLVDLHDEDGLRLAEALINQGYPDQA